MMRTSKSAGGIIAAFMSLVLGPAAVSSDAAEPIAVGHVLGLRSAEMTRDYRIALELMMKRVFKGFGEKISMTAFETPEGSLDAFWEGKIDVTEISSLDFVLLPEIKRERMEIVGSVNLDADKFKKYSVMAAAGTALEDLEGQPIYVIGRGEWNLGRRWLELEIFERFGKPVEDFFGKITVVDYEKPNEVVLPTFFGKSKACLVMDHQLDLLAELNPQIAQQLKPVISSEEFLGVLFVIRSDYGDERIRTLRENTSKLHTTPDGQQAFTLMKVTRMSPASESDLKSVNDLARRMLSTRETQFIAALPTGLEPGEE